MNLRSTDREFVTGLSESIAINPASAYALRRSTIKRGPQRRVLPLEHSDLTTRGRKLLRQASQRHAKPPRTPHGYRIILSR